MLKKILTAAALVATLFAGAASGQEAEEAPASGNWVYVATARDGAKYYVDVDSVTRAGPYVVSSVDRVPREGRVAPRSRAPYELELHRRVDDCRQQAFALLSVEYFGEGDKLIEGAESGWENATLDRAKRDGSGGRVAEFICETASRLPEPTAAFSLVGIGEFDWKSLGKTGGYSYAVLPSSVRVEGDMAVVAVRVIGDKLMVSSDVGYHKSSVALVAFACSSRQAVVTHMDYYAENDALWAAVAQADPEPTAVPESGGLAQAYDFACEQAGGAGSGTGWLSESGYIVTASHVVEGADRIEIYQDGRPLGFADVVRNDPSNDVALLKPRFSTSAYPVLRLASTPARLGSRIVTLGYPLADELGFHDVRFTSGDVSALSGVDVATGRGDDARLLQISAPIQGGNSGGPVIDPDGAVVGIVLSKKQASGDEITQNVNFALKAGYIDNLLREAPPLPERRAGPPTGGPAAAYQGGVFMIVASKGAAAKSEAPAGERYESDPVPAGQKAIDLKPGELLDAEWKIIHSDPESVTAYRRTSVKYLSNGFVGGVMRMQLSADAGEMFGKGVRTTVVMALFKCSENTFAIMRSDRYDANGRHLSGSVRKKMEPEEIAPDGPMAKMAKAVCPAT